MTMSVTTLHAKWRSQLANIGQSHLIAHWEKLSDPQRADLDRQLQEIDWDLFGSVRQKHLARSPEAATTATKKFAPPAAVRLNEEPRGFSRAEARAKGEQLLRRGKVGMILVAGGLGTRLGFDQPKGMFPLGPISQRPLFQILIEKLLAIRNRYQVAIPLYVMTSPATHTATDSYLKEHKYFGLPANDVHLFEQGTMYAVDATSFEILLEEPGRIFTGPDGHGGMLAAIARRGCLADAQRRGIETFFYGQIDNPLLTVCDPEFLGIHALSKSELTSQAVAKTDPKERVGVFVDADGQLQVIEYIDLPEALATARSSDGALTYWAGSVAVHAFDRKFLERMSGKANDVLPFHISKKKVPFVDQAGEVVTPEHPNALRFERFIFDLLPHAANALVVEIDKNVGFAPVKNDDSAATDTPRTSREAMMALHRGWLREAGVEVADATHVEINPLWALDDTEVAAKIAPGTKVSKPTYFQ
jgi:UDP-N-acetylglucosamine/UDP-N-acetylgalactosamine diphosphorylase